MLTKQEAVELNRLIVKCKSSGTIKSLQELNQFVEDITDTDLDIVNFDHSGEMPVFNSHIPVPPAKNLEGWI